MNMFTGKSNGKNNLVKLVLDDPHMICTMTDERIIQLLGIKHKPHKGCGKKSSSDSSDKWEEHFAAHLGMPAKGSVLYHWKQRQLSSGPFGLVSKIEKENESNEGGAVWSVRKVRLDNCFAQKNCAMHSN
jgi:hypothetical protein